MLYELQKSVGGFCLVFVAQYCTPLPFFSIFPAFRLFQNIPSNCLFFPPSVDLPTPCPSFPVPLLHSVSRNIRNDTQNDLMTAMRSSGIRIGDARGGSKGWMRDQIAGLRIKTVSSGIWCGSEVQRGGLGSKL